MDQGDDSGRPPNGTDGWWAATVGSDRCPECGKQAVEERRPGWWSRLGSWLIHGSIRPPSFWCADGHEWSAATYGVLRLRTYGYRRLRLPWSLLRTVLSHRRAMPTPIHYVLSFAVGAVVGVGLELLVGWRWWLVAPSFLGAVWLLYLATAFWGPYRVRLDDLIEVIDWEKAQARRHHRLEEAIQKGSRVAYGVDGWAGPAALSAWGNTPSDGLTLDHGDREHDLWLAVTTRTGDQTPREVRRTHLFFELVAEEHRLREQPDIDSIMRRPAPWAMGEAMPPWVPATMRVDGVITPCESVIRGDLWAAVVEIGETAIEVEARGGDPASTSLRRVDSLEPYFEGLRHRQRPTTG
jgi:hypothetical protein